MGITIGQQWKHLPIWGQVEESMDLYLKINCITPLVWIYTISSLITTSGKIASI